MKALATLVTGCLIAQAGWAQDAWLDFRAQHRPHDAGASGWMFALLSPPTSPQGWDETMARLLAGQDLELPNLPSPAAQALLKREALPITTTWVLLSPEGEVKGSGSTFPSGDRLLDLLRQGGLTPSWERLEAFLREHPDHGEARADALKAALTLAFFRITREQQAGKIPLTSGPVEERLFRCQIPDTEAGNNAALRILEGVQAPLEALISMPDWTTSEDAFSHTYSLWVAGAQRVPQLQPSLQKMRRQLASALEQGGNGIMLGSCLMNLGPEGCGALLGQLRRRGADPDQPWPSTDLVLSLGLAGSILDPAEFLKTLDSLVLPGAPPIPSPDNWKSLTTTRIHLLQQRILISSKLERWESIASDLAEIRRLSGRRWALFKSIAQSNAPKLKEQSQLKPIFELPPLADLPLPPAPPPLRLILVGDAPWLRQWLPLKDSAPLAPWEPSELRWEVADQNLAALLRARQGWDATPRWALLRAESVLASGLSCPTPEALATHLASQGPSRYQRLSTYLEHHPDHQDIRRKRVAWIRARLPNPALEAVMVEDAKILKTGINLSATEQWTPDVKLWEDAAQRTLPQLEDQLQRWPSDSQAWRSWIAWSRLHPRHPSTYALSQRLHLWRNRQTWAAALPREVHLAVADEFRKQRHFEEMRTWFQGAWEGLQDSHASTRAADSSQLQRWEESIVRPLREALTSLRRDAELLALEKTWAAMQGKEGKK